MVYAYKHAYSVFPKSAHINTHYGMLRCDISLSLSLHRRLNESSRWLKASLRCDMSYCIISLNHIIIQLYVALSLTLQTLRSNIFIVVHYLNLYIMLFLFCEYCAISSNYQILLSNKAIECVNLLQ